MISRRQLYAAGEPLGDGATRGKLGGGRVLGFGGDSSSSSAVTNTQTTNTSYQDNRQAIDNRQSNTTTNIGSGNIGSTLTDVGNVETNSRNVTTVTMSDQGAIKAGQEIANAALAGNSNTTASVLDLTKILFSKSQQSLDANVQLAGQLASGANQAYSDATAQATGNKSLILAGIAVVGIVGFMAFKHH